MKNNFTCIQFGKTNDSNRWYNESTNHFTAKSAERYGIDSMCIAGQFGFAVIEETEDTWKVLDDRSMLPPSGFSIECRNHNFSIQPAPQFVLA